MKVFKYFQKYLQCSIFFYTPCKERKVTIYNRIKNIGSVTLFWDNLYNIK